MASSQAIGQSMDTMPDSIKPANTINLRFDHYRIKYPLIAREYGIEGKVQLAFDVDSTCALINRRVTKGIGGGCEEEAMKSLEAAEKDLKIRYGNSCPALKNLTHEVIFKLHLRK